MKVAIAGAGISGAYLSFLLRNRGVCVHLYDRPSQSGCGLTPCAWGVSSMFTKLLSQVGLDGNDYVLRRFDHLFMDEVRLEVDLLTIDKPRLVRDLLQDAELRFVPVPVGEYDRVIDASGVERTLLPPFDEDLVLDCAQFLVKSARPLPNRVQLGGIGYAWTLPLDKDRYHIGCGSLLLDPLRQLQHLGWLGDLNQDEGTHILCRCTGRIRLTGPRQAQPFVVERGGTEIWGVGEAIGCVAPLAGEGIVPSLRSAQLLVDAWDDPVRYGQALLEEFGWMEEERAILERLRWGQSIGLRQARVLRRNSQRMGMQVGLRDALVLLQRMGNTSA